MRGAQDVRYLRPLIDELYSLVGGEFRTQINSILIKIGAGSLTSVATIPALAATNVSTFVPGHLAYVQSPKTYWNYEPKSTATPDGVSIVAATGGTGNWLIANAVGMEPVISVLAFGVKGDGVTDDTANIHTAFTATAITGQSVFFPALNYFVTGNGPEMPPGINIISASGAVASGPGNAGLAAVFAEQVSLRAAPLGLPLTLPSGITQTRPVNFATPLFWIDTEREITFAAGLVAQVNDQSGANNNVVQAVPANQAGFNQFDADYGDAPSLFFTGNNFLSSPGVAAANTFVQPLTFYVVGKITNATGAFFEGVTNRIILRTGGGSLQFFAGNLVTGPANDGLAHVFCLVVNGANSALYMDRMDVPLFTGNAGAGTLDILELGGNPGLGDGLIGTIGEIAMFQGAHSAYQRQVVGWSMGQDHGPNSLIVCDGNSLTLGPGGGVVPYPTQLATLLNDPSIVIINNGVGGETTPNMNIFSQTNTDPRYTPKFRKAVTMEWEITNDLFFGATTVQAYANWAQNCLARRAVGWKVITFSVLPRANLGTPVTFEASRQTINARMRQNWRAYADAFVDVAADPRIGYAGAEFDNNWYDGSLVHLNTAGFLLVAQMAQNAFNSLVWP